MSSNNSKSKPISDKEIIGCLLFLGVVIVLMYIFAPEVINGIKAVINHFK